MIKKISLLFVGCVVAFKIIGAVEGEMITRRANTRMLIDVKHPIRSGELKQALFINQKPQLDGTIYDERPGTGTPRPIQPGRAYDCDGVDDYVEFGGDASFRITGDLTLSAWVNPDTISGTDYVLAFGLLGETLDDNALYAMYTDGGVWKYVHEYGAGVNQIITFSESATTGTWQHVAMVRDDTAKTVTLYIDGVLADTGSYAISAAGGTIGTLNLMKFPSNAITLWDGKISDARIYNVAKNATEIAEIAANAADTIGLVLHAKCDDTHATIAYDSSGNGNNGTKVNTTPATFHYEGNDVPYSFQNEVGYTDGLFIDSNGTGGGSYSPSVTYISENALSGDFKVDYVIESTSSTQVFGVQAESATIASNNYNQIDYGIQIRSPSASEVRVWENSAFTDYTVDSNAGDRITFERTGTSLTMARNGVVFHTKASASSSDMYATYTSGALESLGIHLEYFSGQKPGGNTAVATGFDLTNLYVPRDESDTANDVLGNPLQYTGEAPANARLVQSTCATFDGVDDYVAYGINPIDFDGTDFTVFIRFNTSEGGLFRLVNNRGAGAIGTYAGLQIGGDVGKLDNCYVDDGAGNSIQMFNNAVAYNDGAWHSACFTWDTATGTVKSYVDGLEVKDQTNASLIGADLGNPTRPLTVGRESNLTSTQCLDGKISDFRVFSSTLSAADVLAAHNNTLDTAPDLWSPFSEGAGTTIYDISGNDNHGTAGDITESSFWGTTQDVFHYNIVNGFSLYEHASSDDLYVPYGANGIPLTITTPSGYTKTYDAPSGPWHNGAESKIDFTGGVAAPGTSTWEQAWTAGAARSNPLFARTNGNKHDHLLAYGSVKSGAELDAIDRYTQTIVPVESMIARAGMNINDGFYHWTSGIPTNNLAKHLSWPFAGGAIDPNTLDRDLNWTFSGTVLFGLTLREGHPSGDYVITYTGPAGAVEFIGTNASVDGLTWTKSSPIEEFHVQVNASIDMTTLNIRHNSWPANETWNQQFKDYVGRFGIIRFLDWSKTNRATNTVPWQASGDHFEWADRPLPGQWSYFSNSSAAGADGLSVPVEAMVDLANAINADPWFPIHVKASDAYVLALAQYVDANLEPGLLARFERSNEVWNGQFPQKAYTLSLYDGTSVTNAFNDDAKTKYMHHKLSQAWGGIIKGVNANTNRFKMVLGIQHEAGLEYGVFDELGTTNLDEFASAPYVGGSLPGNQVDIDHPELDNILGIGTDPNQGLDYIFNVWIPNSRTNVNSFTSAKVAQIAVEHSIDYLTYEGGQHLSHSNDTVLSVLVAANRDTRMHQVYLDIISDWDTITGNAPYVFFSSTRSYIDTDTTPIFPFGHKEYEGQALSTTHKLRAIFEHFATSP